MAIYYGLDSSTSSNFFSSMMGTGSSGNAFSSLYSLLGDYSSIQNGSYRKLVKAYYAQMEETDGTSKTGRNSQAGTDSASVNSAETKQMVEVGNKAKSLKTSSEDLLERGTNSLFKKVDVKNEETGETEKQYDTDKIYKAVKQFTEDYNSLVSQTSESTNVSVLRKGVNMVQDMAVYEDSLQDMGITINSDNTLSIDEDKFKQADMTDVKSLFNGSVSLTSKIYQKASDIGNLAANASSNGLYDSSASYVNSLSGALYNDYF